VKFQRYGSVAGVAVAAALALSACGSDNNGAPAGSSTNTGAAAGGSSASSAACPSGTLKAAGSTAQTNAISQWTKDYQSSCSGVTVDYNSNGSGAGVTAFIQKQADFAGSDYALSTTQAGQVTSAGRCGSGSAVDIPAVPGAIAVVFNVPGVTSLNLSAKVLAGIYNGTITSWNDPQIKADNSSANLPNLKIQPFMRSDTSGTSYNFSNYLNHLGGFAAANKQFPSKTAQGVKGSSAVAAKVKSTSGGIGYVEYSYATQNSLSYAAVSNAQNAFVPLTQTNAANFIAKAQVAQNGSDTKLTFDYTYAAADAYPATLVTYEIVCGTGNDATQLPLIKGFLNYIVSSSAQQELTNLGYVPLPSNIAQADATAIAGLK
jgi:phosphate transport system substrate-binding protein